MIATLIKRVIQIAFTAAIALTLGQNARAYTQAIHEIDLVSEKNPIASRVDLPYFVEQGQSGILNVRWQIDLPAQLFAAEIPALLIPQPVQGARFRIDGQPIYELAPSDELTLRNWYSPVLIPLPKAMMNPTGDTKIEVEQQGHLRGWFIAPMLVGELGALQPLHNTYQLISQTLNTTINVLCGFVGVFLAIVGWRSDSKLHLYGGLIACIWSLLIGIALTPEIPTESWHLWRLSLYFLTGWLVYYEILFNFTIYRKQLRTGYKFAIMLTMNVGWIGFGLFGKSAEVLLDIAWTGLIVCIYALTLIWLIIIAVHRKDWRRIIPIFIFLLVALGLAFHDYALQTGWLPITLPTKPQELWENLALQPIYLAHLILPAFIGMTLWLVGKDHIQITRKQLLHERQLRQERERIVSDIHDGVGSRINLLLWSMRSTSPSQSHIASELHNCMEELRFAINPPEAGHDTLHSTLKALVERLAESAPSGVEILYERLGQSSAEVSSEIALHMYKAAQECMSNALRHSGATRIVVQLVHRDSEIEVSIKDNGQGIPDWDNATQQQVQRSSTSLGLRSLQQRMQHRNGRSRIDSSAEGTHVRLIASLTDSVTA